MAGKGWCTLRPSFRFSTLVTTEHAVVPHTRFSPFLFHTTTHHPCYSHTRRSMTTTTDTSTTTRGKFIVFEGIDGSGKGTQIKQCVSFLFEHDKNFDIYLTREPTRDFAQIRTKMRESTDVRQGAEWYAEMFLRDRRNHVTSYIEPALARGTHVLCDRYKPSTLAYQHAQGMALEQLIQMHDGLLVPDITFIFDLEADTAFERRRSDGATDVFDKDLAFQRKLRDEYRAVQALLSKQGENVVLIDANGTREVIAEQIRSHVLSLFATT
eukprot:TRINITY_DN15267_c0_g1_i1.p1 TRINITY_DN15267_c0_g1~~TRINITY_DN15267_c0_g1_i1.p1  ORF type:complete len:268 (-),score=29.50 TRINITY_DN15267_c0_g1_i1:17-820(-)